MMNSKAIQKMRILRSLFFLYAPLFLALFYTQCVTKVEPCDGDTSADPDYDCLPFSPELSEPERDDAGNYKIPISGLAGYEKYEYQKVCYSEDTKMEDVNWGEKVDGTAPGDASSVDIGSVTELCFVRIRACNQYGCGRWSDGIKIVGGLIPPGGLRVDGLTPASNEEYYVVGSLSYTVAWNSVSLALIDVDHYEYRENGGSEVSTGNNTNADLAKDAYAQSYSYQVRTCGRFDNNPSLECGAWSSALRVNLLLPMPALLETDEQNSYDRRYILSWSSVDSAAGYQLQESSDGVRTGIRLQGWALRSPTRPSKHQRQTISTVCGLVLFPIRMISAQMMISAAAPGKAVLPSMCLIWMLILF